MPSTGTVLAWKPSRYTVRVQDESKRWLVYNSMTGAIGAVPKDREGEILPLLRDGFKGTLMGQAKQLADRGFLVPEYADEDLRAQLLKQRRQSARGLHLILMPTEECNFRCNYCYEDFARGAMDRNTRKGVKNLVAKSLASLDRLDVNWFGGEPLEEIGIIEELSQYMIAATRAKGIPYSANIVTNGYHLDRRNLRTLVDCGVSRIQVTVDGLPDQHDAKRVRKDGGATFARIWENLRAAKKAPYRFHMAIRVNFDPKTLADLEPFLRRLVDEFAGDDRFSVFFRPVGHWGGDNDENVEICTGVAANSAEYESTRKAQAMGLQSAGTYPFLRPGGSICYAANPNSFVVGADGTLYKCTVALDKDFNKIGRLHADGTMVIDDDKFALWVTSDDSKDAVCQSCVFRPACQGASCPLVRIESGRRPCPTPKKQLRRSLITVWEHFEKFGRLEPANASGLGIAD